MNRKDRRSVKATKPSGAMSVEGLQALLRDAIAHHEAGRLPEAEKLYRRITTAQPNAAGILNSLGSVLRHQGRAEEAVTFFQRALEISPLDADINNNLGNACYSLRRFAAARTHYETALLLDPRSAKTLNNLGTLSTREEKFPEAEKYFGQALMMAPDFAETYNNYGEVLRLQNRLDDALHFFRQAIALNPAYADAHWNAAFVYLLKGDFINGWAAAEWRWRSEAIQKKHGFTAPLWDGGSLENKTILLHTEQGLGDSIQFIRYAPLVKARGGEVWLGCVKSLERLFRTVAGIDRIFTDSRHIPAVDMQAPLLSLPGILGTNSIADIPAGVPYLRSEPLLRAQWRERLAKFPGLKVGIAWRGNPEHGNDHNRSMTADQFQSFLGGDGLCVVNLQKDVTQAEIAVLGNKRQFFDGAPFLNDLSDTAALHDELDLVIAVDTAVCHLAGSLARPVWVLLPFAPDWRWLPDRTDTPWYPSMRLFRQRAPGDWRHPMDAVKDALAEKIAGLAA